MRKPTRTLLACLGAFAVGVGATVAAAEPWDHHAAARTARPRGHATANRPVVVPARVGIFAPWVNQENLNPGTADWSLGPQAADAIEGYANVPSAQRGDTVTLYVSTRAPRFHVDVYRMGWYQGLGSRLVWRSPEAPGKRQAAPTVTRATNLVEARWDPSLVITVGASWPPGVYLLKLVASDGMQQWVPLTVRDDTSTAAFLAVDAVATWQAYNDWGGCSLYACHGKNARGSRAEVVSFDRPYKLGSGAGDFPGNELPFIMRAEQLGLDVTYATSVDVHERPDLLLGHKAVLSLGHDEYWSKSMRDGAEAARDKGVNLAFLGANASYRQIRFEPSVLGPDRHEVNYRSTADPITRQDRSQATVSWREAPVNRPENTLIGEMYECNPVRADMVVTDPGAWVFAGTGLTAGQHLQGTVGTEYDRYQSGPGVPDNVEILAHSPVRCRGHSSYADMTYYSAPSGAGVFATGTNWWVSKFTAPGPGSPYNATVVQITQNVLSVFGAGPAGVGHPSVANAKSVARSSTSRSAPRGE